jgi:hypothetical protein
MSLVMQCHKSPTSSRSPQRRGAELGTHQTYDMAKARQEAFDVAGQLSMANN